MKRIQSIVRSAFTFGFIYAIGKLIQLGRFDLLSELMIAFFVYTFVCIFAPFALESAFAQRYLSTLRRNSFKQKKQ